MKTLGRFSAAHNRRASSSRPFGVVRQVGIDLQADISIFAVRPVVERPELVGGALHVALAEGFVDGLGTFALKRHGPNVLVVIVAVRNRLLEDGWIRGHPPQSILLDQAPEPAAGDQIPPDVVQPDGLAERSQLFQRIVFHVPVSLFSSSNTCCANPDKPEKLPQRPKGTKKKCLLKFSFVSWWRKCFAIFFCFCYK